MATFVVALGFILYYLSYIRAHGILMVIIFFSREQIYALIYQKVLQRKHLIL